ncbi:MAG: diguanylate cyclase [Gammaproteobacteria bacterium]
MNLFKQLKKIRKIDNTIPLVSLTFVSFILILFILSFKYNRYLEELEAIIVTEELESHKMHLNSELMELARGRTRLTSQIIDTEDVFEQDELNVQLESYAGRFASFRQQLLGLDLSIEEQNILKLHESIVPVILPAQRRVVELAMSDEVGDIQQARKLLYQVVYPRQSQMIETFGKMIALEQQRISELTKLAKQSTVEMKNNSNLFVSVILLVLVFLSFVVIGRIRKIQNNLMKSYEGMEQKVESRTKDLQFARDELQRYFDIADKYVIASHTNAKGIIIYASEAFCHISKYSESELIGRSHNIVRHPDMPKSLYEDMWGTIKQGKPWRGEIKNRAKDGSAYWVDVNIEPRLSVRGDIIGYAAIRQDITDKKRIEELSITDSLTQLYNRLKLDEVLSYEVDRVNRYDYDLSVILFDIDHFKNINDSFGHPIGDAVLMAIADITKGAVRNADTAGRWGGEEFMVICPDTDLQGVVNLAEKIRYEISSYDFPVAGCRSSSFGVATYQKNEGEAGLLKRVDAVLYKAKENGRNRVEVAD